jgi:hypothetical protein
MASFRIKFTFQFVTMDSVKCPSQSLTAVQASKSAGWCRNFALPVVMPTGTGDETFDGGERFPTVGHNSQAVMRPRARCAKMRVEIAVFASISTTVPPIGCSAQ